MSVAVTRGDERGQCFPKRLRLRRRPEFLRVQEGGQRFTSEPLLALVQVRPPAPAPAAPPEGSPPAAAPAAGARGPTRLGLTVSSKVGNAVERARLRRHLRELFRTRRAQWPQGLDVVIVARNAAKDAPRPVLTRAFDGLTRQLQRRYGAAAASGPRRPGPPRAQAAPPPPSPPDGGTGE